MSAELTRTRREHTPIYYDQRIRLEEHDIEWMMDAAGMNTPIPAWKQEVEKETPSREDSLG